MKRINESYDVVVCGGGLAGFCAAVAAARQGAKTVIVHNRPVFGGVSSSEVRVTPEGAACHHYYGRETGIIQEALVEERARNHDWMDNGRINSIWDMVLYDIAERTPGLTFHLNTNVEDLLMEGRRIKAVVARVLNAELLLEISGKIFVDATGDAFVCDRAGCKWKIGEESRDEYDEIHAPPAASENTMGNSILFLARDVGHPVEFHPPEWAKRYDNPDFFYKQGRHLYGELTNGYWWIEIGVPYDTVHDNEKIRHELSRHLFGVWDWIKNRDPNTVKRARNLALDWYGQVPGKRENRRVMGDLFLTAGPIYEGKVFDDEVAYGGWFIDLHTPGGLLAESSEPLAAHNYSDGEDDYRVYSHVGPYSIPLRIMIARDAENLMMVGRCVSVSHVALGTIRVMSTLAAMGQAAGTAAAVALEKQLSIHDLPRDAVHEVQQRLLKDGAFLPNVFNEDSADIAGEAQVSASSQARLSGAGPDDAGVDGGVPALEGAEKETDDKNAGRLDNPRGQVIPVAAGKLDSVSVCLSNDSGADIRLPVKLVRLDHIWDYRAELPQPAFGEIIVPPGEKQWVEWEPKVKIDAPGFLRLELDANDSVRWHRAGRMLPGMVSVFKFCSSKFKKYRNGVPMSIRVSPRQPCYSPANVINGISRPAKQVNLWRSEGGDREPWLELSWKSPQKIATVQLVFSGQLMFRPGLYPPFFHDPQTVKDYDILAKRDGGWKTAASVRGNYQPFNRVVLDNPVTTECLRIVFKATNGDQSAAVYEVRCYGQ